MDVRYAAVTALAQLAENSDQAWHLAVNFNI